MIVIGDDWGEVVLKASNSLAALQTWFQDKCLTLNFKKTNFIAFSMRPSLVPDIDSITCHKQVGCVANCGCPTISQVRHVKYLGVIIDQCLTWEDHIKSLNLKLRKLIPVCLEVRNYMTRDSKRILYNALILPHITYGIVAWGCTHSSKLNSLSVTQKRLIKILLKKPSRYSTHELFKEMRVLNIHQMYERTTLVFVYREFLSGRLLRTFSSTRAADKITLSLSRMNSTLGQRLYSYRGVVLFNALPTSLVRVILTLEKFKGLLKLHYVDRAINTTA